MPISRTKIGTAGDWIKCARWQRSYNAGARPQRLLWASTGTKDPKASDTLYIKALAAPFTVNTMPDDQQERVARLALKMKRASAP